MNFPKEVIIKLRMPQFGGRHWRIGTALTQEGNWNIEGSEKRMSEAGI